MSRVTYEDELGREVVVIVDYNECRYKTNGICYMNRDWRKLGKKCYGCKGGEEWKEQKR